MGTDSTRTPSGWSTISLINVVTASAISFECSMMKTPIVFPVSGTVPASAVVPSRYVLPKEETDICP